MDNLPLNLSKKDLIMSAGHQVKYTVADEHIENAADNISLMDSATNKSVSSFNLGDEALASGLSVSMVRTPLSGLMYSDMSENKTGDVESGGLEDSGISQDEGGVDKNCKLCGSRFNTPRVLACLHVFCEPCLSKLLLEEYALGRMSPSLRKHINCPTCKQVTRLGSKGVNSLPLDYVHTNIVDISTIPSEELFCTSCKTKNKAVSYCNNCSYFLCGGCDNAHKFMRCFDNHEVVSIVHLQNAATEKPITVHKPLFCDVHSTETLKYYCFNCQIPVCQECLIAEHKSNDHYYDTIAASAKPAREDIEGLIILAKSKVEYCDSAAGNLSSALTALQSQQDCSSHNIRDTCKSYKKIIEKCRDLSLAELATLHSERELKIMYLMQNLENIMSKFDGTCKFALRVLEHANATEFLSLKKFISTQFIHLIDNTPTFDVNFSVIFEPNTEKFEKLAKNMFGSFYTEPVAPSPKEYTPPATLPSTPPVLRNDCVRNTSGSQGLNTTLGTASSPTSLPNSSMHSTFDADFSMLTNRGYLQQSSPKDTTYVIASNLNSTLKGQLSKDLGNGNINDNGGLRSNINSSYSSTFSNRYEAGGRHVNETILKFNLLRGASDGNDAEKSQKSLTDGPQKAVKNNDLPTKRSNYKYLSSGRTPETMYDYALPDIIRSPFDTAAYISSRAKATPMEIRLKFGVLGSSEGHFNSPHGFCLGVDEQIVIADTNNHRIQVFEKTGDRVMQFGVPGKEEGYLWFPRKVAVILETTKYVVCDRGSERSRLQIFSKYGQFLRKIAIRYIDIVAGLAVNSKGHIVAVDSVSPTVFVISEDGELLRWFDCSNFMREPSDIVIRDNKYYVCDFKGHCVVVFTEDGRFEYRIGDEKVTCFPNGIDISSAGDILIGDSHGNRFHVACYTNEGVLQSEYECPHVKVSRCCGLKITSEGYVVTLAKNNHHVLILNTLFVQ